MELDKDELNATNKNTFEHKYNEMYQEMKKYMNLYNVEKEENEIKDKVINLMAQDLTTEYHSKNWIIQYYKDKAEIQKQVKEMLE